VVFDLGGVLLRNGGPHQIVDHFPGVDADKVVEIILGPLGQDTDHPWHRLERGETTMAEVRSAQRQAMIDSGLRLPTHLRRDVVFELSEVMISFVAELRSMGLRTGMLTNNVAELRDRWWPLAPWSELFDDIVDSHEVGMRKPNPAIYRLSLTRLGATPERSVFLDDVAQNVTAAQQVGMHGVRVDPFDPEPAIAATKALAGLT
jgi:putative hydrolase of the HAD superfamily